MVRKGTPVPAVDAIVASIAINRELTLVTEKQALSVDKNESSED